MSSRYKAGTQRKGSGSLGGIFNHSESRIFMNRRSEQQTSIDAEADEEIIQQFILPKDFEKKIRTWGWDSAWAGARFMKWGCRGLALARNQGLQGR